MKELIQKALKAVGLSEDLWDKISVTSDTEIESAVKKLASETRENSIKAALKEKGLDGDLDKLLQSKVDQAVTKAIQTHDANKSLEADAKIKADADVKAKEAEAKKKADELNNLDGDKKTIAELKQMIIDQDAKISGLKDQVSGVANSLTAVDRKTLIEAKIKAAGLNPNFAEFVTATESDKIEAQVNNLKATHAIQKQIDNDKLIAGGGRIITGSGTEGFEDATIAAFAKSRASDVVEIKGKASKQILAQQKAG